VEPLPPGAGRWQISTMPRQTCSCCSSAVGRGSVINVHEPEVEKLDATFAQGAILIHSEVPRRREIS
jgi:hypothetical protein